MPPANGSGTPAPAAPSGGGSGTPSGGSGGGSGGGGSVSDQWKSFMGSNPTLDQLMGQAQTQWEHAKYLDLMGSEYAPTGWANVNAAQQAITNMGGTWAIPTGDLTDAQKEALRGWYAGAGPEEAAQSDIAEKQAGREKAREAYDRIGARIDQTGVYPQVLAWAKGQLANPQAIDDLTQRRIEGGIEGQANQASRDFESRLRESTGARGLPGAPGLSGAGTRALGGFERGLGADTRGQIMQSRIQQALANRDYGRQMNQFAMEVQANDPVAMLERERASLEAGLPFQGAGMGYGNYASLLAAMNAAKQADKFDWSNVVNGAIKAGGTILAG